MILTKYKSEILNLLSLVIMVGVSYDVLLRGRNKPDIVITNMDIFRYDDKTPKLLEGDTRLGLGDLGLATNPLTAPFLLKNNTRVAIGNLAVITNPLVATFMIHNEGNAPVRPEDFISPLTLTPKSAGNFFFIESGYPSNKSINPTWTITTNETLVLSPLLLNPGDDIWLRFASSHTNASFDDFTWSSRITGVSQLRVRSFERYNYDKLGPKRYLQFFVIMAPKDILIFLGIYIVLTFLLFGVSARWLLSQSAVRLTTSIAIFSCVTILAAEALQSAITMGPLIQFLGSYLAVVLYIALFALFVIKKIARKAQQGGPGYPSQGAGSPDP